MSKTQLSMKTQITATWKRSHLLVKKVCSLNSGYQPERKRDAFVMIQTHRGKADLAVHLLHRNVTHALNHINIDKLAPLANYPPTGIAEEIKVRRRKDALGRSISRAPKCRSKRLKHCSSPLRQLQVLHPVFLDISIIIKQNLSAIIFFNLSIIPRPILSVRRS
jgi:hypothetical protein